MEGCGPWLLCAMFVAIAGRDVVVPNLAPRKILNESSTAGYGQPTATTTIFIVNTAPQQIAAVNTTLQKLNTGIFTESNKPETTVPEQRACRVDEHSCVIANMQKCLLTDRGQPRCYCKPEYAGKYCDKGAAEVEQTTGDISTGLARETIEELETVDPSLAPATTQKTLAKSSQTESNTSTPHSYESVTVLPNIDRGGVVVAPYVVINSTNYCFASDLLKNESVLIQFFCIGIESALRGESSCSMLSPVDNIRCSLIYTALLCMLTLFFMGLCCTGSNVWKVNRELPQIQYTSSRK